MHNTLPPGYPARLEGEHRLGDHSVILVRPILPSDADHIRTALATADSDTLYRRFFTTRPRLTEQTIEHLARVDYQRRFALVAFAGEQPIGVARYESLPESGEAELAFVVDPQWRGRGVARLLGQMVIAEASRKGIRKLVAYYLATNDAAGGLLLDLGFDGGVVEDGVVTVERTLT